jgi:hypothetical protein
LSWLGTIVVLPSRVVKVLSITSSSIAAIALPSHLLRVLIEGRNLSLLRDQLLVGRAAEVLMTGSVDFETHCSLRELKLIRRRVLG